MTAAGTPPAGPSPRFALTLWQPWASCVVWGPKRVENRTWRAPAELVRAGLVVLIHAGRRDDTDEAWGWAADLWPGLVRAPMPRSAIVGAAEVVACWDLTRAPYPDVALDPWAVGPVAWELGRVWRCVEPVTGVRGARGLWPVPESVLRQVLLEEMPEPPRVRLGA